MPEHAPYVQDAKRLLREQVAKHPSSGVRLLNELVEIPDDHPAVVQVANALRIRGIGAYRG